MDRQAAEEWIRAHVHPIGSIELAHERLWSTVLRVPLTDRVVWFKACAPIQAFEPRLTADLFARWPDLLPEVLAYDQERAWLLLGDAGTPMRALGNPPELWLRVLPRYAELQRGETRYAAEHLVHGVPDLLPATWPARYQDLLQHDLPIDPPEIRRLIEFAPRFEELCRELIARDIPVSIQHDDLHLANVYQDGDRLRVLDWGDASISHPFASLVVTFRFLDEINHLPPGDPWFIRLRDAYLEPWGSGLVETFALAQRTGIFAHAIAALRQRTHFPPAIGTVFDDDLRVILRRCLHRIDGN